jgi:hypothetical protein
MNSRFGLSALFTLTAAMVIASHGAGLVGNFRHLQGGWRDKISEVRALALLDGSCSSGQDLAAAATATFAHARTLRLDFLCRTQGFSSHERHPATPAFEPDRSDH